MVRTGVGVERRAAVTGVRMVAYSRPGARVGSEL